MTLEDRLRAGFIRVAAEIKTLKAAQDAWLGVATTIVSPPGTVGFPGTRTYYMRVQRAPAGLTISKIALGVATSVGNVSVAVHRSTGTGVAAVPSTQVATSGAVACPAVAPYVEIPLSSAVTVARGDWLALSCDNILAAFAGITVQTAGAAGAVTVNDPIVRVGAGHPCPTTPVLTSVAPAARAFQLVGIP